MSSFRRQTVFTILFTLAFFPTDSIADDCRPVTWSNDAKIARFAEMTGTATLSTPITSSVRNTGGRIRILEVKPGELNCRAWARTHEHVNYYTCTEICDKYQITTDYFFWLNPTLKTDCSDIQPRSRYCYDGCKSSITYSFEQDQGAKN